MNSKRFCKGVGGAFLVLLLICPLASQMKGLKFNGVNIPYTLKYEDTIIEKGKYDLEVMVPETASVRYFYLRIIEKKDALCILAGKKLHYHTEKVSELHKDPNIPDKPRLTMRRHPVKKKLYIYFESGKKAVDYPFEKIRFEIDYIE
jgi:hypothetical protein